MSKHLHSPIILRLKKQSASQDSDMQNAGRKISLGSQLGRQEYQQNLRVPEEDPKLRRRSWNEDSGRVSAELRRNVYSDKPRPQSLAINPQDATDNQRRMYAMSTWDSSSDLYGSESDLSLSASGVPHKTACPASLACKPCVTKQTSGSCT